MKKICLFICLILSYVPVYSASDLEPIIPFKLIGDNVTQLIVLMDSLEFTPDSINRNKFSSIFGNTKNAEYLIKQQRQLVADPHNSKGMTPEEIEKSRIGHPDFRLVHPKSISAKLQKYIVLSYTTEKEAQKSKESLSKNSSVVSLSESKGQANDFLSIANDPLNLNLDEYQYGLFHMNFQDISSTTAWDRVKGHAYVGVVDTGLQIDNPSTTSINEGNPDFLNSLKSHFSWNFVDNNNDVTFSPVLGIFAGHGQNVSGIIAADSNNNIGVTGTCWYCSISFAKVESVDSQKVSAYEFLSTSGAQVINSSFRMKSGNAFDCSQQSDPACDALQLISLRDIVHIAAAGNGTNGQSPSASQGRSTFIEFPASDDRTIAVGAVDITGQRAGFSDYGAELDVVAPGVNILSTFVNAHNWNSPWSCGDSFGTNNIIQLPVMNPLFYDVNSDNEPSYGTCTGTSMSTPHIAGLSALIRSADPLLNRLNVKDILISSSSEYPIKDPELGYGIPNATLAIEKTLGQVNGTVLPNRLTPLFSFYNYTAEDSFYTTVPQMATAALKGTLLPQPPSSVSYLPSYGYATPPYFGFPDHLIWPWVLSTPVAEVYIFTTEINPISQAQPLVPLYRMSYQGTNGSNNLNLDHFYATALSEVSAAKAVGYDLDGIEGYIFSPFFAQPTGTIALYRRYNPTRDDHAIFPADKLSQMTSAGYTTTAGNGDVIGFVYSNQDSDNDYLIDGFENLIGTCDNNPDSNGNGLSDGTEVLGYPRTDPVNATCGSAASPSYPWQDNATGSVYTGMAWDYAMGYHFTPLVNGTIDQLGGYFDGVKQIKLFDKATGQLLAQTTVTNGGSSPIMWKYNNITPISVQANQTYTVAVYLAGSGGTYRYIAPSSFPMTFDGNFRIDSSTYVSTSGNPSAIPTNNAVPSYMYGQADVRFTPN